MKKDCPVVLFVGPVPGVITGQSMAFSKLVENTKHEYEVVDADTQSYSVASKVIKFIKIIFQVLFSLVRYDVGSVYLSCTRTFFGSVKDVLIIYLSFLFRVKKICVHLHGMDMLPFLSNITSVHRFFIRHAYDLTTDLIVLDQAMLDQFSFVNPGVNRHVISNFVDDELLSLPPPVPVDSDDIRIAYLSNMMPSKGVKCLLESVSYLNANGYNFSLKCAGVYIDDDGVDGDDFRRSLDKYWSGKIRYIGPVYGDEKKDLLRWANIFILPSYYSAEAFPLVILEAMAAGCFIVVSDHNILPSIVSSSRGCVVSKKSAQSISDCLTRLDLKAVYDVSCYNYKVARDVYTLDKHVGLVDEVLS